MASSPKIDISSALAESAGSTRRALPPAPAPSPVSAEPPPSPKAKTRDGLVSVQVYVPKPVRAQLHIMRAEQDRPVEDLLVEALNDFFDKYGKPAIATRKL